MLMSSEMQLFFCKTDVSDEQSVQDTINKTVEIFGVSQISVNCAEVETAAKVLSKKGPVPIAILTEPFRLT